MKRLLLNKFLLSAALSYGCYLIALVISFSFPLESDIGTFKYALLVGSFTIFPIYFIFCFGLLLIKEKILVKQFEIILILVAGGAFIFMVLNLFIFRVEGISYYLFLAIILAFSMFTIEKRTKSIN